MLQLAFFRGLDAVEMFFVFFCFLTLGQYGIPRPWYFIFQINYWGGVPLEAGRPIPQAPSEQNERNRPQKLPFFFLSQSVYMILSFLSF